ncbi:MAG: creatininase family protein [Bauldia sp.]|nr:creatininase family protein [Bauldia sp.]
MRDDYGEAVFDEVRWERMFPDQLERRFADWPVLYQTYGLCEPHGPQNAVGLDALKAHAIACLTARRHGGIVAPPDYGHIHEIGDYAIWALDMIGEVKRDWLSAVPPWHHFRTVCWHLRIADRLGFKAVVLITGHYGVNYRDLKTLLDLAQPYVGARLYSLADFEADTAGFDGDGNIHGDHAGRIETSQLWALEPAAVDISRLPPKDAPGPHFAMGPDAYEANRLAGQAMVERQVAFLAATATELVAEFDRLSPTTRLSSFADVEAMWAEAVAPTLPDFLSMQRDPHGTGIAVPETSRWAVNWTPPAA